MNGFSPHQLLSFSLPLFQVQPILGNGHSTLPCVLPVSSSVSQVAKLPKLPATVHRSVISRKGLSSGSEADNSSSSPVPAWAFALLKSSFFLPCQLEAHKHLRKNESTFFCTTCASSLHPHSLCQHCLPKHAGHHLIQIRRYVYCDVVRAVDINPHVDTSGVQNYIINQAKVMFLNPRPNSKHGKEGMADTCRTCHRHLREGFSYCSLACKLDPLKPPGLAVPPAGIPAPEALEGCCSCCTGSPTALTEERCRTAPDPAAVAPTSSSGPDGSCSSEDCETACTEGPGGSHDSSSSAGCSHETSPAAPSSPAHTGAPSVLPLPCPFPSHTLAPSALNLTPGASAAPAVNLVHNFPLLFPSMDLHSQAMLAGLLSAWGHQWQVAAANCSLPQLPLSLPPLPLLPLAGVPGSAPAPVVCAPASAAPLSSMHLPCKRAESEDCEDASYPPCQASPSQLASGDLNCTGAGSSCGSGSDASLRIGSSRLTAMEQLLAAADGLCRGSASAALTHRRVSEEGGPHGDVGAAHLSRAASTPLAAARVKRAWQDVDAEAGPPAEEVDPPTHGSPPPSHVEDADPPTQGAALPTTHALCDWQVSLLMREEDSDVRVSRRKRGRPASSPSA